MQNFDGFSAKKLLFTAAAVAINNRSRATDLKSMFLFDMLRDLVHEFAVQMKYLTAAQALQVQVLPAVMGAVAELIRGMASLLVRILYNLASGF